MSSRIKILRKPNLSGTPGHLPASKSISNRVLIMNALGGGQSQLQNLSDANDTVLMQKLINSTDEILDVEDAGTTMRFLTAFLAITGKQKVLTGTDRMKLRPIGILVNALEELGAQIEYLENDGYPPVRLSGFAGQKTRTLRIRGDVSSQYISALMMIAPVLPEGLDLMLEGKVGSRPYIEMTASLMRKFGAEVVVGDVTVHVAHQPYESSSYHVESDWSAAGYWFAFTALAESAELLLPNIMLRSLQGDRVVVDIMEQLGVKAEPRGNDLLLTKKESLQPLTWDFTHCPDLAQTVAVVCAAKGVRGVFTGLESLRIKETDRISALQQELKKLNASLVEESGTWTLIPSPVLPETVPVIQTYLDHRMAMAFAPIASVRDVVIENPDVVRKSYPGFWKDIGKMGFILTET